MLLSARVYFWPLLILCIFLLALPIFIREKYSNGLLIDGDSYKSLRLGEEFNKDVLFSYDNLSYGGKTFVEERGWYTLLGVNPGFMTKYLPFIFGILSFILFYFIFSSFKHDLRGIASLLLIVSPPFLYFFSVASKYAGAIFFVLLGVFLFVKKKEWLSIIAFFISGFFSIITLFLVVLGFLYYGISKKKYKSFLIILVGFILVFVLQFYNVFTFGFPKLFSFEDFAFYKLFSQTFFGLGGKSGFGFFMFVLSLIGIYSYYKEKYKFLLVYISLLLLLFLSFYFNFLLSYISFALVFFAALGLTPFIYGNWKSELFRFLTVLVLFCGILFSLLVFYDRVSSFEPTPQFFESIEFLKEQQIDSFVLSHYDNGYYITYADKKSFIDEDFLYASNAFTKLETLNILYNTKELDPAIALLDDNNIKYILVDSKMKREIFNNRDERFLFLLRYSPNRFATILNNSEVEIWYNRPIPLA